jgi:large-conductance mechanosensitive channel
MNLLPKQFDLISRIKSRENFINKADQLIQVVNFLIISTIIMRIVLVINKILIYSQDLSTNY